MEMRTQHAHKEWWWPNRAPRGQRGHNLSRVIVEPLQTKKCVLSRLHACGAPTKPYCPQCPAAGSIASALIAAGRAQRWDVPAHRPCTPAPVHLCCARCIRMAACGIYCSFVALASAGRQLTQNVCYLSLYKSTTERSIINYASCFAFTPTAQQSCRKFDQTWAKPTRHECMEA